MKKLRALAFICAAAIAFGAAGCGNGGIRIDAPSWYAGAAGTSNASIAATGGTIAAPGIAIDGYFVLPASNQTLPVSWTVVASLTPPSQLAHATLPACRQTAL